MRTLENPLASKSRNSVSGVYISVLNLLPHHRSKAQSFLTVQILRNSDLSGDGKVNKVYRRLVSDLNKIIENGIDLSIGNKYPVRFVHWEGDKKEINLLMGLNGNFAFSVFFDPNSYIKQEDRKNAILSGDLNPHNFGLRNKESYLTDVENITTGDAGFIQSRGLKFDSVLNEIKYFHCANIGSMTPWCVSSIQF